MKTIKNKVQALQPFTYDPTEHEMLPLGESEVEGVLMSHWDSVLTAYEETGTVVRRRRISIPADQINACVERINISTGEITFNRANLEALYAQFGLELPQEAPPAP